MELYEQILCEVIAKEVVPSLRIDSVKLVEMKCYQTIRKIYEIIADETLDDHDCFWRIEQMISSITAGHRDGGFLFQQQLTLVLNLDIIYWI